MCFSRQVVNRTTQAILQAAIAGLLIATVLQCVTILVMHKVEKLYWDAFNSRHIAKHGVSMEEVENACQNAAVTFATYGRRILLIGQAAEDKVLAVVLSPTGTAGEYYPVTARPASRKERRLYRTLKGGEKAA